MTESYSYIPQITNTLISNRKTQRSWFKKYLQFSYDSHNSFDRKVLD